MHTYSIMSGHYNTPRVQLDILRAVIIDSLDVQKIYMLSTQRMFYAVAFKQCNNLLFLTYIHTIKIRQDDCLDCVVLC